MKKTSLFIALVFCTIHLNAKHSVLLQDTVKHDSIRITPNNEKTPVRSIGAFVFAGKDEFAFQTYAGASVLNTLRGHLPNLVIGPNPYAITTGIRGGASMLVIDGLPYSGAIANYYNLNSFEYESISAISSGSVLVPYGGLAANGGIFLRGKTGKDRRKPSFEFNSSPTLIWGTADNDFAAYDQWMLNNGIAYAQDYGPVDLRVSYNSAFILNDPEQSMNAHGLHNLRLNTGFDIGKKFHARLIVDGRSQAQQNTVDDLYRSQPIRSELTSTERNLHANLALEYKPLQWLSVTSQSSLGRIRLESELENPAFISAQETEYKRKFANLFVTARHAITTGLALKEFAGIQYEISDYFGEFTQAYADGTNYGSRGKTEVKNKVLVGGIGLQWKNYLLVDAQYRRDQFSAFPADDSRNGYSISSAFIFTEVLDLSNSLFSSGKVRASTGKSIMTDGAGYPSVRSGSSTLAPGVLANPSLSPFTGRKTSEAGIDLSFFDARINLNVTRFRDINDQTIEQVPVNPDTGFGSVYIDIGDLHMKGWELALAGTPVGGDQFSYTTSLVWANYKTKVVSDQPPLPGGNPAMSVDAYPDWTGSMLNQFRIGKFFTTFLADVTWGGEFLKRSSDPSRPSSYTIEDGTNVTLRDISVGYSWHFGKTQLLRCSVSGRNLWTIYAVSEGDIQFPMESFSQQRSATLSVTFTF